MVDGQNPPIININFLDTNLTTSLDGLFHHRIPESFLRLAIVGGNLTALPDNLGDIWENHAFDTINIQHTLLTHVPSTMHKLRMTKIRLISNSIASLPESTFSSQRLVLLHLSGNPLRELPANIGDTSALTELVVEDTEVNEITAQVSEWCKRRRRLKGGLEYVITFHGSPVCASNSTIDDPTRSQLCETDYRNAEGTYQMEFIRQQRPFE
ncbi:hypothetical protein PINS_up012036 [Pythium insidiosum]|nr:hypothetical protein PINS_up012036 [Pythium insidiosum]